MSKFTDGIIRLLGASTTEGTRAPIESVGKVLIVGSPNVGKSLLFNRLTGQYVTVSNYPGTTVEVSRGALRTPAGVLEVIDTPGIYSVNPITSEERVTYDLLVAEAVRTVVHVVDAKNLERMLPLTLQLAEAGLPVMLVLNMIDEARDLGIEINVAKMQDLLGIPVLETAATTRTGITELIRRIPDVKPARDVQIDYGPDIEQALSDIAARLGNTAPLSPRSLALLLLQSDRAAFDALLPRHSIGQSAAILQQVADAQIKLDHSAHYYCTYAVKRRVADILRSAVLLPPPGHQTLREQLSRALMKPAYGIPVLLLVLYLGLYKFVGVFGAGLMVDFIQTWFSDHIGPGADRLFAWLIPWARLRELFTGEYGIIPLGIRYAIAIVFPIVGTFFVAFSVLEDSGYLPRLAMMIDRLFKRIGLNGRAVIPMVLGFGCGTMATMVTRTLETKRERLIATFLLSLAIPCSAQMGVILGLLASHPAGMLVWIGFVGLLFLLTGFLAAKLIPGEKPSFYMELPPLRLPRPSNVIAKTLSRMTWYFKEVLPLFILASVLIWLGQITGVFQFLIRCIEPVVNLMGLPDEAAQIFLFGFFRRDYGAAGLYDLQEAGILNGNQLTIAAIALTLFLPCIAQFLIMAKERGTRTSFAIAGITSALAIASGYVVNLALRFWNISL